MITKDRQYLSLAFIQIFGFRLCVICLTSDWWSLICFVTYLKIIQVLIWNMKLENLWVQPYSHPPPLPPVLPVGEILGTALILIIVMWLKYCRDIQCDSIYVGLLDGFWKGYTPKCHWDFVEASENLNHHLCAPLHCQFKGEGKKKKKETGKTLTLDDLCSVTIVMNPAWKPTHFCLEPWLADTCHKRKQGKRTNLII